MLIDEKKCYPCGGANFNKRPGSVCDRPELIVFECASCGLVCLSSIDHIRVGFYENSGMHDGEEMPNIQAWLNEISWNDELHFQYLKSVLPNRKLLDHGCGAGGFLLKARELAAMAHDVEPETRLRNHYQSHGLTVFQNLSETPKDIREGVRYYNHVTCAEAHSRPKINNE